jgi:hypothetical protein
MNDKIARNISLVKYGIVCAQLLFDFNLTEGRHLETSSRLRTCPFSTVRLAIFPPFQRISFPTSRGLSPLKLEN